MNWQRANIQAAATYLRERMAAGADDVRTKAVYEGLLDVLEPNRRLVRQQREMAAHAKTNVPVQMTRDRRNMHDRRGHTDRRKANVEAPGGSDRRSGIDRRTGEDRRGGRR